MKQKHWVLLFIIFLAGDIAGVQLNSSLLQMICKPVIIPALIGYLDSEVKTITKGLPTWVLLALLFSWLGDVLLMFQDKNENFFLFGLSAFLLAHVFYITFFHKIRIREGIKPNIFWLLIVVAYYAGLISWLSPYLGEMKLPVRIYGIVISIMFMLAMHLLSIKNKIAGKWMMCGALLFVISDSVLAINKFYQPFEAANVIIMLTYGLAQLFIVKGAASYINSRDKE
jgi:uncharacterized membrane protein YhhN